MIFADFKFTDLSTGSLDSTMSSLCQINNEYFIYHELTLTVCNALMIENVTV